MPFGGLLTVGLIGAGSSLFNGILGSNAASNAANDQVTAEGNALNFQKDIWQQEQQNIAPWLSAGGTSMGNLMTALSNGTFGAGSLPSVPTAPGAYTGTFTAPTLAEAQATPGYQFTAQQGSKGVLEGAAAAGGAISGGTLKALDQYNTNLANTTYNDVYNRALSTYNTGLQAYQANLQGYQSQLAGYNTALGAQQQEYNQMFAPAQLGEQAATGINQVGQNVSTNVGNLMTGIGNAQAAGTVGSTNAITGAVSNGTNSLLQAILMGKYLGSGGSGGQIVQDPGGSLPPGFWTGSGAPGLDSGVGPG